MLPAMDQTQPNACFCGCGRAVGFGRARAVNRVAARMRAEIEAGDPDRWREDGRLLLDELRRRIHGDDDAGALDLERLRTWFEAGHAEAADLELFQAASARPSSLRDEMSSFR